MSAGFVNLVAHTGFSLLMLVFLLFPTSDFYPWGALLMGGLCFPCLTLLANAALEHGREVERIQQEVFNFTIENSVSGCCAAGHVDATTGQQVFCDREIILRCVKAWFGSLQSFEDHVRGEVRAVLVHQLTNGAFSYLNNVQVTSPIMLLTLDLWSSKVARDGGHHVEVIISLVTVWLVVVPTLCFVLWRLAYRLRRACRTTPKQLLLSVLIIFIAVGIYACFAALEIICRLLIEDEVGCFSKTGGC